MPKPLYVSWAFENGSPMDWEELPGGTVSFSPCFDYERATGNRQLTHWHFKLFGEKGRQVRLRIPPKENVYGGRRVNAFPEPVGSQFSSDGVSWTPLVFHPSPDKGIEASLTLPSDETLFARIEPYAVPQLSSLLKSLEGRSEAKVEIIGETVEGRPLEMISLSRGPGRKSALLRARAHPWEAGGSWFVEGVVDRALSDPAILDELDIRILPMACKDGVVRGLTRFNVNGCDLNRGFGKGLSFSRDGALENLHLANWLESRKASGDLPSFAMDLHDDDYGRLHLNDSRDQGHMERMRLLESLMRECTFFTEGTERGAGSTFGAGLHELYGIDSVVYELNSNWLASANLVPGSKTWKEFGFQFAEALRRLFKAAYNKGA